MELINALIPVLPIEEEIHDTAETHSSFITANTQTCSLNELKQKHIIPVFVKDNEPLISHSEFIDAAEELFSDIFHGETILKPKIRVSHPIKGRVPDAKNKPAHLLLENEKTLYYERMMFVIEIPSINDVIDGNGLSLTIGGVKSYSQDNLYSRSMSDQHFKFFIGFKNKVCTNLCVWSDGFMGDIKVKNLGQLKAAMRSLIDGYNAKYHLFHLKQLVNYSITEQQFAHLIGRSRMYQHLPNDLKSSIPPLLLGDNQMSAVVKDFYRDASFCKDENGNLNLWKLYNLFTGVNKTSYIDSFLDRSVNSFEVVEQIARSIKEQENCWYLN